MFANWAFEHRSQVKVWMKENYKEQKMIQLTMPQNYKRMRTKNTQNLILLSTFVFIKNN
ncbi:unnamed protein product [Paramecium pentaurelia]|uniref:Uncharacterized protein n=1 Tax=Paramecium pentaurelia TaxID=43138 RepID=A0A8S1X2K0_9CILI|nr:unnamed protein product [Paramecium pentaurelia]